MLGFATVDLLARDSTLTAWLTATQDATHAGHANAVIFTLGDDTVSRRALGMICDRYVILTDRTPREHPLLTGWGVKPCDLAMLARQTTVGQAAIMTAFEKYRTKPGKADSTEPPVPAPLEQAALETGTAQQLTLAVANQVMRTWTTWLTTTGERVKRWARMPDGRKGEAPALLPAEFGQNYTIQPVRALPL